MPSRSAVVCCISHQALSWSSALAASSSASSFLLPRAGARTRMSATAARGLIGTRGKLQQASAAYQALQQVPRRARVDAVLLLVAAGLALVGQREYELLARGAEVAGDLVERVECGVLHQAGDAARSGERPLLAGVGDLDGLGRERAVQDPVDGRYGRRRQGDPHEGPAPGWAGDDCGRRGR